MHDCSHMKKLELLNVCSARSFYSHVFIQIHLPLLTTISVLTKYLLYSLMTGFDNLRPDHTVVLTQKITFIFTSIILGIANSEELHVKLLREYFER